MNRADKRRPNEPKHEAKRSPFDVNDLSNKREIGSEKGTLWSLSSHKTGHGIKQLRDPDLEKLWQSDGVQPHKINIEFAKRTAVTHISLWLNVRRDDSYTPTKIQVKAGTGWHDLTEVRFREWNQSDEPYQWKHFLLSCANPRDTRWEEAIGYEPPSSSPSVGLQPIHTWMIQISILANHQNGKDTHVRSCLVWGPKPQEDQSRTETGQNRSQNHVAPVSQATRMFASLR
ncbi:unnamed protein product [Sympodiomycopsis kandeliae]